MLHELKTFSLHLPSASDLQNPLHALLLPAEQQRAARLCVAEKKQQFILSRAVLRLLLAQTLQVATCSLNIQYRKSGKPFIQSAQQVHFNIAHSYDYAVFALSSQSVGIDIEYCQASVNVQQLLSVFHHQERKLLHRYDDQRHVFFELWTRKEAWAKLHGDLAHTDWSRWHVPAKKASTKIFVHRDYVAKCMQMFDSQHQHQALSMPYLKRLLDQQ